MRDYGDRHCLAIANGILAEGDDEMPLGSTANAHLEEEIATELRKAFLAGLKSVRT